MAHVGGSGLYILKVSDKLVKIVNFVSVFYLYVTYR